MPTSPPCSRWKRWLWRCAPDEGARCSEQARRVVVAGALPGRLLTRSLRAVGGMATRSSEVVEEADDKLAAAVAKILTGGG
jgi:hypothetical protein